MAPRVVGRRLLAFAAVAAAASTVGAGFGFGLGALTPNSDGASPAPEKVASSPPPAVEDTARTTTEKPSQVPRVQVLSATLRPAITTSGRARRRARVSIRLRVSNRGAATLAPEDPLLLVGDDRLSPDPSATGAAGTLLAPLEAGASAMGNLRFEIAGATTTRLTVRPRARLRIAGRTVRVDITISPRSAPSG